jgi:hypothetical protein
VRKILENLEAWLIEAMRKNAPVAGGDSELFFLRVAPKAFGEKMPDAPSVDHWNGIDWSGYI